MIIPHAVLPGPLYRAVKPVRDRHYLQFLKTWPCSGCGQSWGIDPAHTGPHALSRKACDLQAIPLCRKCHEAFDAAPARFLAERKIDLPALIRLLNFRYGRREAA